MQHVCAAVEVRSDSLDTLPQTLDGNLFGRRAGIGLAFPGLYPHVWIRSAEFLWDGGGMTRARLMFAGLTVCCSVLAAVSALLRTENRHLRGQLARAGHSEKAASRFRRVRVGDTLVCFLKIRPRASRTTGHGHLRRFRPEARFPAELSWKQPRGVAA